MFVYRPLGDLIITVGIGTPHDSEYYRAMITRPGKFAVRPTGMTLRQILMLVEDYIGTDTGYLRGFSYKIHDEFYSRYCDLEVDVPSYRARGLTTRNAFIEILSNAKPSDQARIIKGVFEKQPSSVNATSDADRKQKDAYEKLLGIASRLETHGQVESPTIVATSEVVHKALKDSEILLQSSGPQSAIDRAHTALHGYLKHLCEKRGITLPDDPSLTFLFKAIRVQFPEFSKAIPHDDEARKIFGSMAQALESLNTIRNRGTLAHPNELLLDAPEAMLYINLTRALLAYIEAKLKP